MGVVMTKPKISVPNRRAFMFQIRGELLDLDFDNDNEADPTAESLDWHQTRQWPHLESE